LLLSFWLVLYVVEEVKLNNSLFNWPERMKGLFEHSQARLQSRHEAVEDVIRKRQKSVGDKLAELFKEVDSFRKREVK
jgi:hypothetical protein